MNMNGLMKSKAAPKLHNLAAGTVQLEDFLAFSTRKVFDIRSQLASTRLQTVYGPCEQTVYTVDRPCEQTVYTVVL